MNRRFLGHLATGVALAACFEVGFALAAQTTANNPPASGNTSAPQAAFVANPDPSAYVTVLEGTPLQVLTDKPFNTRQAKEGASLSFTLNQDIVVRGTLIIPHGVTLHGTVVRSKRGGKLAGTPTLILELTSLDLEGRSYPLFSYQFKVEGSSKAPLTETLAANGAFYGALAGAVASGRTGASTEGQRLADVGAGAAAGAGVGAVAAMVSGDSVVRVPAEAQLTFYLAAPIAVVPVSAREAARIAKENHHGEPALYLRGEAP